MRTSQRVGGENEEGGERRGDMEWVCRRWNERKVVSAPVGCYRYSQLEAGTRRGRESDVGGEVSWSLLSYPTNSGEVACLSCFKRGNAGQQIVTLSWGGVRFDIKDITEYIEQVIVLNGFLDCETPR